MPALRDNSGTVPVRRCCGSIVRIRYNTTAMGKLGWTAIGILAAAFAADQYWNFGFYTDATLAMLRQMGHSFR